MSDIFHGIQSNDFDEIKAALEENPSCINSQDKFGRVPAMYVAMEDNIPMLKWLSEQEGFDSTIIDNEGKSLIEASFWSGNEEMARYAFSLTHPINPPSPKAPVI